MYGNPIGHEVTIQRHANELINGKVILSNIIRHASLHAGTYWLDLNDWIYEQIIKIHVKLNQDINDPKTTFTEFRILQPSTNENLVTNLIHAYLIFIGFILSLGYMVTNKSKQECMELRFYQDLLLSAPSLNIKSLAAAINYLSSYLSPHLSGLFSL
ncbi:MAG: hypothetical protein A2Z14_03890 [Chloroflexi bacterium RBG_16_48_8]|nr:MAG: hypothetical protein A2Z14_03890 [Chloroflexi bacterium RBG_16_48_8]